jgi:hypothetical protein
MASDEPNVNISGGVHGSTFAVGSHARAESHHHAAPRDAAVEELLAAVRELRADLQRVRATDGTRDLDRALADTEEEIVGTGSAGDGRRRRLRELLTDAQSVLTLFASAGTVAGLLGM